MNHIEVRSGLYRDSVRLMQISAALAQRPGVDRALVAMATAVNLELLAGMGFAAPAGAGPNDLVVAVAARDGDGVTRALAQLEDELAADARGAPAGAAEAGAVPYPAGVTARTTGAAARGLHGPAVALVSTPGRYAFVEAMDALDAGLSVMLFSDNVPVEQELVLKRVAGERGLLVMGPDCGTCVLGGVGLGFANVVRPGPVGLVAASGTGAQHVMSLLAWAGVGISHCLGVGGRDQSVAVGGAATRAALTALDADPATELILVLGKALAADPGDHLAAEPAADLAADLAEAARGLATPVLIAPIGPDRPDLTAVATGVLARVGTPPPAWPCWPAGPAGAAGAAGAGPGGSLRGLFSGGTLALEAMAVASPALGEIRSNTPLYPQWSVKATVDGVLDAPADAHVVLDLGADELTAGRPHPMIDFGPRLAHLATAARDPRCRVVLLDVVLGRGAHADPAATLAPAIAAALGHRRDDLAVVVCVVGTTADPQGLTDQAARLAAAGASCYLSNAEATRHAVRLALGGPR